MEKIKRFILDNWLFKKLYLAKFYLGLGMDQISWFASKFPEIMAIVYLLEKAGIILNIYQIIIMTVVGFVLLLTFGFLVKMLGFYDIEKYVDADKNPVTKELLCAARRINKK